MEVIHRYTLLSSLSHVCAVYSWVYQSSDELDGTSHYGQLGSYGGGGYVQDLASTMEESFALIKPLFDNLWLDRATRAVFVDFTVYNANINLFCVIKYAMSFAFITSYYAIFWIFDPSLFRYNFLLYKGRKYLYLATK